MECGCARIYYLSNSCAIIASIVNPLSKIIPVYIHSKIKTGPSLLKLHNLTWDEITLKCDNTYFFYIFFYRGFLFEYFFYWPSSDEMLHFMEIFNAHLTDKQVRLPTVSEMFQSVRLYTTPALVGNVLIVTLFTFRQPKSIIFPSEEYHFPSTYSWTFESNSQHSKICYSLKVTTRPAQY